MFVKLRLALPGSANHEIGIGVACQGQEWCWPTGKMKLKANKGDSLSVRRRTMQTTTSIFCVPFIKIGLSISLCFSTQGQGTQQAYKNS